MESILQRKPRQHFDTASQPSHVTFDDGSVERRRLRADDTAGDPSTGIPAAASSERRLSPSANNRALALAIGFVT